MNEIVPFEFNTLIYVSVLLAESRLKLIFSYGAKLRRYISSTVHSFNILTLRWYVQLRK